MTVGAFGQRPAYFEVAEPGIQCCAQIPNCNLHLTGWAVIAAKRSYDHAFFVAFFVFKDGFCAPLRQRNGNPTLVESAQLGFNISGANTQKPHWLACYIQLMEAVLDGANPTIGSQA
jgi:hypothetical protein